MKSYILCLFTVLYVFHINKINAQELEECQVCKDPNSYEPENLFDTCMIPGKQPDIFKDSDSCANEGGEMEYITCSEVHSLWELERDPDEDMLKQCESYQIITNSVCCSNTNHVIMNNLVCGSEKQIDIHKVIPDQKSCIINGMANEDYEDEDSCLNNGNGKWENNICGNTLNLMGRILNTDDSIIDGEAKMFFLFIVSMMEETCCMSNQQKQCSICDNGMSKFKYYETHSEGGMCNDIMSEFDSDCSHDNLDEIKELCCDTNTQEGCELSDSYDPNKGLGNRCFNGEMVDFETDKKKDCEGEWKEAYCDDLKKTNDF